VVSRQAVAVADRDQRSLRQPLLQQPVECVLVLFR